MWEAEDESTVFEEKKVKGFEDNDVKKEFGLKGNENGEKLSECVWQVNNDGGP